MTPDLLDLSWRQAAGYGLIVFSLGLLAGFYLHMRLVDRIDRDFLRRQPRKGWQRYD